MPCVFFLEDGSLVETMLQFREMSVLLNQAVNMMFEGLMQVHATPAVIFSNYSSTGWKLSYTGLTKPTIAAVLIQNAYDSIL